MEVGEARARPAPLGDAHAEDFQPKEAGWSCSALTADVGCEPQEQDPYTTSSAPPSRRWPSFGGTQSLHTTRSRAIALPPTDQWGGSRAEHDSSPNGDGYPEVVDRGGSYFIGVAHARASEGARNRRGGENSAMRSDRVGMPKLRIEETPPRQARVDRGEDVIVASKVPLDEERRSTSVRSQRCVRESQIAR